mgnify:CR=1 FL=1
METGLNCAAKSSSDLFPQFGLTLGQDTFRSWFRFVWRGVLFQLGLKGSGLSYSLGFGKLWGCGVARGFLVVYKASGSGLGFRGLV